MTTVGIVGGGQLGRMLALAGYPLGLRFRFLEPDPEAPAGRLAEQRVAGYADREALARFTEGLSVVTYEFENIPLETARFLEECLSLSPPSQALEVSQDRLIEKTFLQQCGAPTPAFAAVDTREALDAALASLGLPCVLKTRRMGYDGKGQFFLHTPEDGERAWSRLGGAPLILEGFVPFEREVSLLSVRGRDGGIVFYPLVENHHRQGILRLSLAPAPDLTPELQAEAEGHARRVLEALGYVGVLAIEFFQRNGRLLANEMAPRVHNSGHWTLEGAETSQFENHLRAILGWPLGPVNRIGTSAMVNLIGELPDERAVLGVPGAHLHLYDKTPRPGRKVGHITLRADDAALLAERLAQLRAVLPANSP